MVRAGQYFNNTGYGLIDSLNYTYSDPLSNQLTNIFEQTPGIQKNKGFKPGPSSGYLYDENGNLISDTHKNMSIQYNYLNLPETINFAGGNQIVYLYDATGKKLQKKVSPDNTGTTTLNQNPIPSDTYQDNEIHSAGNVPNGHHVIFKGSSRIRLNDGFKSYGRFRGENTGTIVQDYCSGIEYHCSILEAIYHSEGRLYFEGDGERYEYTLADHLGNTRVTFADIDGNGFISASTEILQENHYYPFGMKMEGNFSQNTGREDKYLFGGKELQDDFGLNTYDYVTRQYDPALGRFWQIDQLADSFTPWSPFSFGFNNPIRFIDPDGRAPEDIILRGANNSSITITTDIVDINVDASSVIGDIGGNYTIGGDDAVITGLDIVGVVDPTPTSDLIAGSMSAKNGDYLGAGASVAGAALPLIGDAAKIPKIQKGLQRIFDVIKETKAGRKNITSATTLTESEALDAGIEFVGDNAREIGKPGSGVFRSGTPNADGTVNQFRMDNGSLSGSHDPNVPHVHLEIIKANNKAKVNNHIPIKND